MRAQNRIVWLCLGIGLACSVAHAAVNQQAIDDVKAGKLKVARASWWGFDPVESTAALQAAINSGVPKLIIDNVGQPWMVDKMALASNQEIVFEKGVEVIAKRGAFLGTNDTLFTASYRQNVTLTGNGATLRMWRSDYAAPPYKKGEWRHCLGLFSCTNVRVEGLTLKESGGDGIYLGVSHAGVTNKDVVIKDVVCDSNYRQGISVISAENLLIENTVLKNTAGTPPQAGIDFEPNLENERLVNVVMRNCLSENNVGDGYVMYVPPLTAASAPMTLRFENCRSRSNKGTGFELYTGNQPAKAVRGSVEVTNCTFADDETGGITIYNKPVGGCSLRFTNCTVRHCGLKYAQQSPIQLVATAACSEPIGKMVFDRCLIADDLPRQPLAFADRAGGLPVADLTGSLILERQGRRTTVALTPEVLAKWLPNLTLRQIPRYPMDGVQMVPLKPDATLGNVPYPCLRGPSHLVFYARSGQAVHFVGRYKQVGKYGGATLPVAVFSPSNKPVATVRLPFQQEAKGDFVAAETGLYRVEADAGGNMMQMAEPAPPLLLSSEMEPLHPIGTPTRLYFAVPAGTTIFAVKVIGEGPGETVKATLYDPEGKVIGEQDSIGALKQFVVELKPSPTPLVYSLQTARPTQGGILEDHYLDLRGIPPFWALSADTVLVPAAK
jgi:hypothetical protein